MSDSIHAQHRARFLDLLAERNAVAVIPTATTKTRNDDADYKFRPTSDFWYLTGLNEPGACLVLLPGEHGEEHRAVLFLRERDKLREIWDGRRLGLERAPDALGVDAAMDIEELWTELPKLLEGRERIMWRFGDDDVADRRMVETFTSLRDQARGPLEPAKELLDPGPVLHELRVIKSDAELDLMRRAASLSAETHAALMGHVQPGMNECEAEAFLDHRYRSAGSSGAAYSHICAGGANACILHYIENDQPLKDGDLLLVDSGAEWHYYAADITRTFPIGGKFTAEQRALYQVVLDAEEAAIAASGPGVPFDRMHEVALGVIVDGLLEHGLLKGTREEALESGSYRDFFMHKTGHYLGLDVHDCGRYTTEDGSPRPLEPGMVFTVEPGIYVDPENTEVEARWRGIGIRIEDDVLVTNEGHEILTSHVPKAIDEVEAMCAAGSGAQG